MHTQTTNCCPECGRLAEKESKGAGSGSVNEVVSNVQMSLADIKKLRDKIKASVDKSLEVGDVSDLLIKTRDTLISMSLDEVDDPDRNYATPSKEFVFARNELYQALDRLQTIVAAEYIDRQRSGRPIVRQWISATTPMQQLSIFRKHLPDEVDETGIEVVGLLDQSGSMGGVMDHASQATWAIASAVRMTGNQSTMIGFDTDARLLIGRKQTLSATQYPRFGVMGGTNPSDALDMAERVFAETEMPNRLLYIVTDGDWGDQTENANKIRSICSTYNADSILVVLDCHDQTDTRGCHYIVAAEDPMMMCNQISNVIIEISRRCAMRIANETNREA